MTKKHTISIDYTTSTLKTAKGIQEILNEASYRT